MKYFVSTSIYKRGSNGRTTGDSMLDQLLDYVNSFQHVIIADESSRNSFISELQKKVEEYNKARPDKQQYYLDIDDSFIECKIVGGDEFNNEFHIYTAEVLGVYSIHKEGGEA